MSRIFDWFRNSNYPDYFLIGNICLLVLMGLLVLSSASSEKALDFGSSYYFFVRQITMGLLPGLVGFLFGLYFNHQNWKKLALPMLIVCIVMLILVFTPLAPQVNDIRSSHRWLGVGSFTFQPSELLKIFLIVYLAAWLSNTKMNRETNFRKGLLPLLVVCGVIGGLLLLQPATSTVAIIFVAAFVVYFASGAKLRFIGGLIGIGVLAVTVLVLVTPYRMKRLQSYFNPAAYTENYGYQVNQARIAIGSGGLWGVGYGKSTLKASRLPEPMGDSIFAVAAQELGFAGGAFILALFVTLTARMFILARRLPNKDRFGRLVLIGFGTVIALQVFVHIGSISGILPPTGVPLPFVSYGGTALAVFMTMGGIAANISRSAT
jgi:cell division protein FtsW